VRPVWSPFFAFFVGSPRSPPFPSGTHERVAVAKWALKNFFLPFRARPAFGREFSSSQTPGYEPLATLVFPPLPFLISLRQHAAPNKRVSQWISSQAFRTGLSCSCAHPNFIDVSILFELSFRVGRNVANALAIDRGFTDHAMGRPMICASDDRTSGAPYGLRLARSCCCRGAPHGGIFGDYPAAPGPL